MNPWKAGRRLKRINGYSVSRFPTPCDPKILALHREIVTAFGGAEGVRDLGILESAINQPRITSGIVFKVSSISGAMQRVKTSLKQDSETKSLFDKILKKVGQK